MFGLGLSIPRIATQNSGTVSFSPQKLAPVAWWDISKMSTMFQDTTGTVPVSAAGDAVALVQDQSGNGHHLQQSKSSDCPVWQTGAMTWLENAVTTGNGLELPVTLDAVLVVGAFQYLNGTETTFANFGTLYCDDDAATGANRVMGREASANMFITDFDVSVSDGPYNNTLLPLPWSFVTVMRDSGISWPVKHIGSRNNNDTSRRWTGRFAPIAIFDRVLTDSETIQLYTWAQAKLGTA
ncbi:hypothetical protein [Pacificibacter marinus]|uniref:hypothetical protein n=1 Tax=Pacificibacter marinus TaxID=658057 RepID=UPI001C065394|nr:hypothetical protein [Pacificibacter marinus]MBU2867481.1 hypothetical protein [Pacificibacter marinus]